MLYEYLISSYNENSVSFLSTIIYFILSIRLW